MDIEQGRQFLADLEQVVADAGLAVLVEHGRTWMRRVDASGVPVRPGNERADDAPQVGEEAAILDRIAVLLDLVEAALEIRYDVEQEVLAMAKKFSAEELIAEPRVTFAVPERPVDMGTDAGLEHSIMPDDTELRRSAPRGEIRPRGEHFGPIWRMREELELAERVHHVVVATRPTDWDVSWRENG